MKESALVSARGLLSLAAFSAFASAQCSIVTTLGPGTGPAGITRALTELDPDGSGPSPAKLVAGGVFGVSQWDPKTQTWSPVGGGLPGPVYLLEAMPNGDLVAATGNLVSPSFAVELLRFDGTSWTTLLTSLTNSATFHSPSISALHALPNGDLLVGGLFTAIDGAPAASLARWDGTSWSEYAGGVGITVPGDLPRVSTFGEMANGDVVVGGHFTTAGGVAANHIATWDGTTFSPLGSGLDNPGPFASAATVTDLVTRANGDLFACGYFQFAGGVLVNNTAIWDGSNWSAMGAGVAGASIYSGGVTSAEELPNGDIVVGGAIATGGNYDGMVLRWTGTTWDVLANGLGIFVYDVQMTRDSLVAGGQQRWELTTTCPAVADAFGAACPSSGGANELVADTLPWTGSTFSMTATGLPPLSLIAIDGGFAPLGPLTLSSIGLLAAPPACMLHITPEYYEFALSTTGSHSFRWAIPNDPTFAGLSIYWQFVVFEITPAFGILETTSTNALELTIGSY